MSISGGLVGNTTGAIADNLAFSLMARLHVILRRHLGRVTDIEYMRVDSKYCRTVLDMASQVAQEDVQQICAKLEEIYFGEKGLFVSPPPSEPLINKLSAIAARAKAGEPAPKVEAKVEAKSQPVFDTASLPRLEDDTTIDQMYIGRLR